MIKCKLIKSDELFLNIYDFWVLKQAFFMHRRRWYHPKITKLEKISRRKQERAGVKVNTLPIINVLILKINEEDRAFDPTNYLNEKEQYLANLESWKMSFEEELIQRKPYLTRKPIIRRRKIYKFKRVFFTQIIFCRYYFQKQKKNES